MSTTRGRRRPAWVWAVFAAFLLVPLLELWVLIQVGHVIGVWWTLLLLVADSVLGTWLIKREGSRAFEALRTAMRSGRMPTRELADGALIVLGGALMLSPGFVTDLVGVLLILPPTRPFGRRVLTALVARRVTGAVTRRQTARRPGPGGDSVVQGEVVDD